MTGVRGPVRVVGAGLLGTSVGLALSRTGVEVWLEDASRDHVRTAAGLGAGVPGPRGGTAALSVVAVPPAHLADVVAHELGRADVVTDVGSVKSAVVDRLADLGADATAYVGGHPMAGSERSGPLAASAGLFVGRPWAVTPHAASAPEAVAAVETLARACGAAVVRMDVTAHDEAVGLVSHLPHLMAVLVAARLADAPADQLALAGQGVRDVTRIAAGDPGLWRQIVGGNAAAISAGLHRVRDDLDRLLTALAAGDDTVLDGLLASGVRGTEAIPGKHGGPAIAMASVHVVVPDHPGELARLLGDVGESGVNLEDLHIDHDPGRPFGLVEVVVDATATERLRSALESRNWQVHR